MKNIILLFVFIISTPLYSIEQKDTTLYQGQSLVLEFDFANTNECGINIYKTPGNSDESKITVDHENSKSIYRYTPAIGYIGNDTVVLVHGCMVNGQANNVVADTIEYRITISQKTSINLRSSKKEDIYLKNNILTINLQPSQVIGLNITNILGNTIKQYKTFTKVIDMNNLPTGIYFINIKTRSGIITKKLLK